MYTCIFFSFLARRIFLCAGLWHAAVHLAPERVRVYARLRVRAEIARTITPSSGRRSPDDRGYLLRGITIIIIALYIIMVYGAEVRADVVGPWLDLFFEKCACITSMSITFEPRS